MNCSAPSWWNSFLTTGAPPYIKSRAQALPLLLRKEPPSRARISSSLRKGMRRPRKSMSPSRASNSCQMRHHIQQTRGSTVSRHSTVCRAACFQAPAPPCRDSYSSTTITIREGPFRLQFPRGPLGRHCPVDLSSGLAAPVPQWRERQERQCQDLTRALHLLVPEAYPLRYVHYRQVLQGLVLQERPSAARSGSRALAGKSFARAGQCPAQSLAHHAACRPRAVLFSSQSTAHRARRRARAEWSLAGCVQCRVWLLQPPAQVHVLAAGEEPQREVGWSGLQGGQQVCQRALRGLPHAATRPGPHLELRGALGGSLARALRSSLLCPMTLCHSPDAARRHPLDGNVNIATWCSLAKHQRRPLLSRARRTPIWGEAATAAKRKNDIFSVLGIVPV
ncbi:hypothetical protein E2C01_083450 [Portunus trituberculatus]|uniref:Uncharacterized protein n=1 Tax=Portunus trituberculatus TaxID=210409 RepID=A0A5B7IX96_PORTR|nr:hypothetical protein [Portunus trituberculatus]